jgi:hypothetical protein
MSLPVILILTTGVVYKFHRLCEKLIQFPIQLKLFGYLHLQQSTHGAAMSRSGEATRSKIPNPANIPITCHYSQIELCSLLKFCDSIYTSCSSKDNETKKENMREKIKYETGTGTGTARQSFTCILSTGTQFIPMTHYRPIPANPCGAGAAGSWIILTEPNMAQHVPVPVPTVMVPMPSQITHSKKLLSSHTIKV